jgi:hypothetical protein
MKLVKIIFPIVLISLTLSVQGQNQYLEYYRLARIAKKYELQNMPDSALLFYTSAFSKVDYVPENKLKAAIKLSKKLKQKELHKNWSNKLIAQKKGINKEYVKEIESIAKADQAVRSNKNYKAQNKYYECIKEGNCPPQELQKLKAILSKWYEADSANIAKLISLINTKGYPSEKALGVKVSESAFIILLHFDKDTNNFFLKPILDRALLNGEIYPRNYAWLIDRREIMGGRPSYYYHVPFGIEKLSKSEMEEVERRREMIGYGKVSETQIITKKKHSYRVTFID